MIEVHIEPKTSKSDAFQALGLEQFGDVMKRARAVALACGRRINEAVVAEQVPHKLNDQTL